VLYETADVEQCVSADCTISSSQINSRGVTCYFRFHATLDVDGEAYAWKNK